MDEHPSKRHLRGTGILNSGMANAFFPYTFNGDAYDGFADDPDGFADDPDEPATGTGGGEDGGGDATDPQTALRRVVETYFYTGAVEPHHLDVLSREFGGFLFTAQPSFGAAPAMSDATSPMPTRGPDAQKIVLALRALRRTTRVPKASVLPTRDTLGTTMRDFLDEVARAIPEFTETRAKRKRAVVNRHRGVRANDANDANGADDDDSDDDDADDDDDAVDDALDVAIQKQLVDVSRTWCSVPRFAPWAPRAKFTFDRGGGAGADDACPPAPVDLTVRDDVFVEYIRAYRSNRTVGIMKDTYDHPDLVTLVLETEADVWAACGGSSTRLPPDVWITKRGAAVAPDAFGRAAPFDETGAFEAFKEEDASLFEAAPLSNLYVGDQSTLESQVYAACEDEDETIKIVKAFRAWCEKNERAVPLRLTDVLEFGGYDADDVGKAADALLALAVRDGYVRGDGSNAMQQLVFRNVVPRGTRPRVRIAPTGDGDGPGPAGMRFARRGRRVGVRVGRSRASRPGSRTVSGAIIIEGEDEGEDEDEGDSGTVGTAVAGGGGAGGGGEDRGQSANASLDESAIVSAFRRGKERVLRDATREFGERPGGERALIITDPDYRHHFITLCRANYQLKQVSLGANVVTDRRRRILEQERLRRESLYFFQAKNGTATAISSRFVSW